MSNKPRPDAPPPTGVVTFVFTDIEGSTGHWQRYRQDFQSVWLEHNALIRQSLQRHAGVEVRVIGDAFFVVFKSAVKALSFAIDAELSLGQFNWSALLPTLSEVRVRIGLHSGEASLIAERGRAPDYQGHEVNVAARVGSAAHGGQILISSATERLIATQLPQSVDLLDLGLYRLKGVGEERLWQVNHPQLRRDFPPPRSGGAFRHNLPQDFTNFMGREDETEELRLKLSTPDIRLVTLQGPGGVGKTRLAVRVGRLMIEEFHDGVWFVDLAEARQPEEMLSAICRAMSLQPPPDLDLGEYLLDYLRGRRLLLILDNCEQIQEANAVIHRLLTGAEGPTLFVTSRSILQLSSERVHTVRGMPWPQRNGPIGPEQAQRYPSVRLFCERAQQATPDWRLTDENADAVAELCRRLDGSPLALELAAARVRGVTVQEMLERLRDRFRLLASSASDRPDRHRTLWATVDWSYQLLQQEERSFLADLGVFSGGFWLDAAEAVTGNPHAWELAQILQDKSLVSTQMVDGSSRYNLLETVRSFVRELPDSGAEGECLQSAHAGHYLAQMEEYVAAERQQHEWKILLRISPDLENWRAAREWAAGNSPELFVRLGITGARVLSRLGLWREARDWASRAVATVVGQEPQLEAAAYHRLADLHYDLGDLEEAEEHIEAGLTALRGCEEVGIRAEALNLKGVICQARKDWSLAQSCYEAARELWREMGDQPGIAKAEHNLAYLLEKLARFEAAEVEYRAVLAKRREIGDERGVAETLNNLGGLLHRTERWDRALNCYLECADIFARLQYNFGLGLARHNLGELCLKLGDLAAAGEYLRQAERIFDTLGSPYVRTTRELLAGIRLPGGGP